MNVRGDAALERLREIDRNQVFLARCNGLLRLRVGQVFARLAEGRKYKELGFNSIAAYARERLSRSGRWLVESKTVAVRLEELPRIRRAFERGEIGWAAVELLCRHADPESELAVLQLARSCTVRELRGWLTERESEQEEDEPPERGEIVRRLQADHAWQLEATLKLVEYVAGGCSAAESVEWLLAEGMTTLIACDAPGVGDIGEAIHERAEAARAKMRERATEREVREAEVEDALPREWIAGRPVFDPDEPIPASPRALDRMLRELCATAASADLWLGKSLSEFFRGRAWERLGYASDGQYCRERLGLSRSSSWERVALARSTTRFGHVVDAMYEGAIGSCAARMLARVVTPATERAWVERAKVRTFKHLMEEVELVELDARMHGEDADRSPPDEARVRGYHAWQRKVLSGAAFREARGGDGDDGSVRTSAWSGTREGRGAGLVDVTLRLPPDVVDFWHLLEEAFDLSGIDDVFVEWLCRNYTDTWLPTLGPQDKWDDIYARDLYRCTSPVCLRRDCTLHHIVFRAHGGGDEAENVTSPCADDHLFGVHEGTIRVTGEAPYGLTWQIGRDPVMVVRGRERELRGPRAEHVTAGERTRRVPGDAVRVGDQRQVRRPPTRPLHAPDTRSQSASDRQRTRQAACWQTMA